MVADMDTLGLCENDYNEAQYVSYPTSTKRSSVGDDNEVNGTPAEDYARLKEVTIGAYSTLNGRISSNVRRCTSLRRTLDVTIIILVITVIVLTYYIYALRESNILMKQNVDKINRGFVGTITIIKEAQAIQKNKYITSLPKLQKEFQLELEVKANSSKQDGVFYNIIHLTECDRYDVNTPGCRIITIWFRNSTVRVEVTSNLRIAVFDLANVTVGKWIPILIKQRKVSSSYRYTIFINGKEHRDYTNFIPLDFSNVRVYAGDPWFFPQDGYIRNFVLHNFAP